MLSTQQLHMASGYHIRIVQSKLCCETNNSKISMIQHNKSLLLSHVKCPTQEAGSISQSAKDQADHYFCIK